MGRVSQRVGGSVEGTERESSVDSLQFTVSEGEKRAEKTCNAEAQRSQRRMGGIHRTKSVRCKTVHRFADSALSDRVSWAIVVQRSLRSVPQKARHYGRDDRVCDTAKKSAAR